MEYTLCKAIYRFYYFLEDTLFEPFFRMTKAYDSTGVGIRIKEKIKRTDDVNNIVSRCPQNLIMCAETVSEILDRYYGE